MIFFKKDKAIKLGERDAAVILKEDGNIDAILPDVVSETVPENILTGAALVYALTTPSVCDYIRESFLKECGPPEKLKSASNDR